ncbi:MAG: hypothetical protein H6701_14490 [Myxococcales bacterium]|nr:hypothetical protein [Myxococcales bacterium]
MAHHAHFTDSPKVDPAFAKKTFTIGLVVGVVGLAVTALAMFTGEDADAGRKQFFFSWLTAFAFFTTISLGSLFFVIIHHLVRASWSTGWRRIAENLAGNLPLMAVLFIPVLIGLHDIYHWSHAEEVAKDPILQWKEPYLNTGFFIVRAVVFFGVWIAMAMFFRRNSLKQDETGDVALTFRMRWWAPICTLVFALTLTFAHFDWLMSLDPHWFSTIFGVVIFAGSMMSCYATLALTGLWLTKNGELTHTITTANLHDAGKMMFGFTVFWAYVSFSQYYLIWYGNIPEETAWYYRRLHDGWQSIGLLLILGHFIVPFWVLMSRHVKRNRTMLGIGAGWMLLMHFVDLYFMVMPTLHHGLHPHWADLTAVLGIGGLYIAFFARRLASAPVVAHRDPQLVASMEYDNV